MEQQSQWDLTESWLAAKAAADDDALDRLDGIKKGFKMAFDYALDHFTGEGEIQGFLTW